MVSRKVFLSVISSGMRERILLRATDFLFSSWKGSSGRLERYSRSGTEAEENQVGEFCANPIFAAHCLALRPSSAT